MPACLPLLDRDRGDALLIRAVDIRRQIDNLLDEAPRGSQRPRGRAPGCLTTIPRPSRRPGLRLRPRRYPTVDVESHQGESLPVTLMQRAW